MYRVVGLVAHRLASGEVTANAEHHAHAKFLRQHSHCAVAGGETGGKKRRRINAHVRDAPGAGNGYNLTMRPSSQNHIKKSEPDMTL
jgi:hypothetical protein